MTKTRPMPRYIAGFLAILCVGLGAAYLFQKQIGMNLFSHMVDNNLGRQVTDGLPDGLHAGLCGSGSPMPDSSRAGPCVFVIAGKRVYVVDVGEGAPRKLALMGLSPGSVDAVLLTHFHSDHIGGLGELMLQRWALGSHQAPLAIFGPQGVDSVVQGFNAAYALDKDYRIARHEKAIMNPVSAGAVARPFTMTRGSDASQLVLHEGGLIITAFPVDHGSVFPSVGYRFDYRGRSVVISGDTTASPTLARYAAGADVLFHEGLQTAMVSIMHDDAVRKNKPALANILANIPSYHTTPEDAARIAQQAGVGHLVFYHVIPPLPTAYLNAAFLGDAPSLFKGTITVGTDGTFVSLPAGRKAATVRALN